MADTFPNGYANRLVRFDELRERHEPKMHPEYARRIFACIESADGLVGIGGGWRSAATQAANHAKAPNTFAPPGSSFHESQHWASGLDAYAAVDTVGRHGRHDQAWNWMRDHAGEFGLCTFWNVNGEPWHVQFVDLPKGARSWKQAGCPDPPTFTLTSSGASPADASGTGGTASPYGPYPWNDAKPVLRNGWHGDLVRYVQLVIDRAAGGHIEVDGVFGPQTEGRVKDVQFVAQLAPTGVIDWNGTWQFVDQLAGHTRHAAPPPNAVVEDVDHGWYWVQRGDSPWRVAARVWGAGERHVELDPTDPPAPGFAAADHRIRLPGVAGHATVVVAGDDRRTLIERLAPGRDWTVLRQRFLDLNGGEHRTLLPGDVVFLDVGV
ncbi:MAG TPA: peptidoglycan-binding protein [Ilumatobacter sp.]|nr:peptidoglycan-binding protein [Ilumatobacter sp.]